MPDYNIYIHALGSSTGGDASATKPLGTGTDEQTVASPFDNFTTGVKQAQGFASSGFGSAFNTGVAMLGKSVPIVALAILLANIADKTVSTGFGHLESYTGNFAYSMNYNAFKTYIGALMNPVGFALKEAHRQAEFRKQNLRIEQERTLIGRSFLTKVGV